MPCRCCNNPLQLGCIDSCALLILDIANTLAGGIFTLETDYLGAKIRLFSEIATDGDKPFFDMRQLNSNYAFKAYLYRNDLPVVLVDAEAAEYDCLTFNTVFATPTQNTVSKELTIL